MGIFTQKVYHDTDAGGLCLFIDIHRYKKLFHKYSYFLIIDGTLHSGSETIRPDSAGPAKAAGVSLASGAVRPKANHVAFTESLSNPAWAAKPATKGRGVQAQVE